MRATAWQTARGAPGSAVREAGAKRSSRATCASVRPVAGSVATSSVGARRAAAHAWQEASNASSIQAAGRSPAWRSTAASFQ